MRKAFTLVELSIVLIVVAIIAGNLLTIAINMSEADKIKETELILDKIEKSIVNYFTEYGAIPCPADATISQNNSGFGVSTTDGVNSCTGTSGNWYSTSSYSNYDLGSVPTKTLQIPDELAFDAWGRRITYAMVECCSTSSNSSTGTNVSLSNPVYRSNYNFLNSCGFSNISSSAGCLGTATDANTFRIKDASGTIKDTVAVDTTENSDTGIPYVLISHGKNGHGAYPHDGGTNRINAAAQNTTSSAFNLSSDEIQNAHMNADGSNINYTNSGGGIYVQKAPNYSVGSNYFDDIVRYNTKEQLIRKADRFPVLKTITNKSGNYISTYSTNFCNLAATIVSNSASYCSNTYPSPTSCSTYISTLAQQILNLCS